MAEEDPAVVRAVLSEHGHEVPARGRISAEHMAAYHELVNGDKPGDAGEYDAGVTAADFDAAEPDVDAGAEPETERKPRKLRTPRRLPALRGKPKPKGRGKSKPRVPVDRIIERVWEGLARLATPVSVPIARTLDMQAPVAGLIMEDIVKGTVVDRVLQPVARAEEKAEKVIALAGPPLIVGALAAAEGLPEEQRAIRQAFLVPALRECLVVWVKVAGDKIEEKQRRDEEMGPVNEQVDRLLNIIFGNTVAEAEPAHAA